MSLLNLPLEILENIFKYCDYNSFINLSHSCKTLNKIYKNYGIKHIPKYIGIIKFSVQYPSLTIEWGNGDEYDESDEEDEVIGSQYYSTFTKLKTKYIITHNIDKLKEFFLKYSDGQQLIVHRVPNPTGIYGGTVYVSGKAKKIRYYFKELQFGEQIILNDMSDFTQCKLDFSTRADILNQQLFNDYISNNDGFVGIPLYRCEEIIENREIEKIKFFSELDYIKNNFYKKNKVDYINKYIGSDKLNDAILLLKTVVKETLYTSQYHINPMNIISLRFISNSDETDSINRFIKEDISELEFRFKLKYPFIEEYKTDFGINEININKLNKM